jgi:hypothetical protein
LPGKAKTASLPMRQLHTGDCASAMENYCHSDGRLLPQRWKTIAITEAQIPDVRFDLVIALL